MAGQETMLVSAEREGFDVEAQKSLLETSAAGEGSETDSGTKKLQMLILLIRSTELFKLGANYAAGITSSSSNSATNEPITSSNEILIAQVPETVAAVEVPADSTEDILNAHPASDNYKRTIELQQMQRKMITDIVRGEDLNQLVSFGGVEGVAEALNTDLENGRCTPFSIPPQEIFECKPSQLSEFLLTFLTSFLAAFNHYTIFLLSCAAVLSLVFGIKEEGLHMGWFNGGILILTIMIIVIAKTIRKCWQEWPHHYKLENSWQSNGTNLQVRVVRGGDCQLLREKDVEVGDIAWLQKGDQVPADGLFVRGQALELDGGNSIKSTIVDEKNPFLFYGSEVINGDAKMLVTSIVPVTVWGEMMSQAIGTSADNECKFESYLHKLYTCVQTAGLIKSILIIIVLFLRYKAEKLDDERTYRPDSTGEATRVRTIINAIKGVLTVSKGTAGVLTTLLSVSLVGITEGVPFAISVAAVRRISKTLKHKASVKDYLAFAKMARVTTIITDEHGLIADRKMEIDKFYVGEEFITESSNVASEVIEGLCDGIGSQFLIRTDDCESELKPLISWAEAKLGMKKESVINQYEYRNHEGHKPLQEPCQVLMAKHGNGGYLHCKGPLEYILSLCSHYYGIDGLVREMDRGKKSRLGEAMGHMLAEGAEVIAYACKRIEHFDEESVKPNQLIFLAMISMKERNIQETSEAVSMLLMEGRITTVLASRDDVSVLEPIGQKYGLLTHGSDDLVITAQRFRTWTHEHRMNNVEKIRILGNCNLPSDKILLIKCLREKSQVVALVAHQIFDAPALKQADIAITYGSQSSEVARECCHFCIPDGNCFSLFVNVIKNGRGFIESIRKYIQLQLIFTTSSSLINFVAVVFWGDAPITALQLFWLNLVVGLVGGLALLTGPSTTTLTAQPAESSAELITRQMWRNIAIQVSYQTSIFLTLQHRGQAILGTRGVRIRSVIYNAFFLCQTFNKFIAREPGRKNIFSGLFHNNFWFGVAFVLFIICQAIFAVAEEFLSSNPGLNFKLWGICVLIGLVSCLLDWTGKVASNFHC